MITGAMSFNGSIFGVHLARRFYAIPRREPILCHKNGHDRAPGSPPDDGSPAQPVPGELPLSADRTPAGLRVSVDIPKAFIIRYPDRRVRHPSSAGALPSFPAKGSASNWDAPGSEFR